MTPEHLHLPCPARHTIVVGDIHGCMDELRLLLDEVSFGPEDLLIAVGDLVDRGPGTWDVARFFRNTPNAFSVLGNHERRLAGAVKGTSFPSWSQLHSLHHLPESEHQDWAGWLGCLPAIIETDEVIITHSRLDPDNALVDQDPYHTCAVGGPAVTIERDEEDVPRWFHDWRAKHGGSRTICFGHARHERVELIPRELYSLDTAAARGFWLTALVLPDFRLVQVPVAQDHKALSLLEWESIQLERLDPERVSIHQYLDLKRQEAPSPFANRVLHQFEERLDQAGVPAGLAELRRRLQEHHGPMPAPGPARGDYYQQARQMYPRPIHRLVSWLLSDHALEADIFLKIYLGKDLGTALEGLAEIRRVLDDQD